MSDSPASHAPAVLALEAWVAPEERPFVAEAARLLAECLEAAAGAPCRVSLTCADAVRSDFLNPQAPSLPDELRDRQLVPADVVAYRGNLYRAGPKIMLFSLLADLTQTALRHKEQGYLFLPLSGWSSAWSEAQRDWVTAHFHEEPGLDVSAAGLHWQEICTALQGTNLGAPFLCTMFRHAPVAALRERIQHFNLLAVQISSTTGAFVVDLDSALAHQGARTLQTDYRLGGDQATAAAADALVATLLRAGLDDFLSPELQARALAALEARQDAPGWFETRLYHLRIYHFLQGLASLGYPGNHGNPQQLDRLGHCMCSAASNFAQLPQPIGSTQHRYLVDSLRQLGTGYLALAQAVQARDLQAQTRAGETIRAGELQFKTFWDAFHAFSSRSAALDR